MATIKLNLNGVTIEVEKDLVSQGLENGEVKVESDKLIAKSEDTVVYTKEQHETYTTNLKNEEYKKGKTAGEEMAMKAVKNASGYEIEGYKDAETFVKAFKARVTEETGQKPNERIQELEGALQASKDNFKTLETEFTTYKNGITERETRTKKDDALMSFLPSEGLKVDKDITLIALKNKAGIDIDFSEEGKALVTVNGKIEKNTLLEPVDAKEFIEGKLNSLELIAKPQGGGGGGDDTGGKEGGYDSFVKEMKQKNIEEGTQEFAQEMNKRIQDKTLNV